MNFQRVVFRFLALTMAATAHGRPVANPSYEWLNSRADLVAVVTVTSCVATADTPDDGSFSGRDLSRYVGVETHFRVESVIKGDTNLASIAVVHFGYKGPKPDFNGSTFISFLPPEKSLVVFPQADFGKPDTGTGSPYAIAGATFLAYLRRLPDGRFAPVVPQYDAAFAFRLLAIPQESERYRQHEELK